MLLDLDSIFDPDRRVGSHARPEPDSAEGTTQRSPGAVTTVILPVDLRGEWHYLWDERAAIMEYDGGLPREKAEHLAMIEVVELMKAAGMVRP